jgi:hypothetical protein
MTFWIGVIVFVLVSQYKKRQPVTIGTRQPRPMPPHRLPRVCAPDQKTPLSSMVHAPTPPIVCAPVVAPKAPTAKAPVVVTVSTQTRLNALTALRRLGFSQNEAQAQLDTSLGLAIQQSLQGGSVSVPTAMKCPDGTPGKLVLAVPACRPPRDESAPAQSSVRAVRQEGSHVRYTFRLRNVCASSRMNASLTEDQISDLLDSMG